jgi:hypothetical protein
MAKPAKAPCTSSLLQAVVDIELQPDDASEAQIDGRAVS